MIKISVAIATFNEEDNIKDCLQSVAQLADEVIVVDGSSRDKTRQIAREQGARVIKTRPEPMFHINKNKAIKACSGDWILVLDADERVSPLLTEEIKGLVKKWQSGEAVGYWLKRKNFFLGRFLTKGGQYPDPVIRLFKKDKGWHPEVSVHEQIKIDGQVGWLKNDLLHLASPSFTRYLTRENRYSTLEAANLQKAAVKINLISFPNFLLLKPLGTFFSLYFRHRGFQDGFPGFVFAFFSGMHHFLAFVKYWECRRKNHQRSIKKDWI
ncbi:MAG: glycosyltransferase family 2 protein [Candidatus Pacebacteria bacterium]|nr:glycosyltransferase family 2 protein [Candidatus Paceibacterota bacterium]